MAATRLSAAGSMAMPDVSTVIGAHDEKVSDPAEVPAALKRYVEAAPSSRAALLHARVTRI